MLVPSTSVDYVLIIDRDQFCSLVFMLSNLYFLGCAYNGEFDSALQRCNSFASGWPITFALSALPFVVRLVQSVKRYADSGLITHLINVSCRL
jgi:xenotropic and polytropic retrovirus receptor 1